MLLLLADFAVSPLRGLLFIRISIESWIDFCYSNFGVEFVFVVFSWRCCLAPSSRVALHWGRDVKPVCCCLALSSHSCYVASPSTTCSQSTSRGVRRGARKTRRWSPPRCIHVPSSPKTRKLFKSLSVPRCIHVYVNTAGPTAI